MLPGNATERHQLQAQKILSSPTNDQTEQVYSFIQERNQNLLMVHVEGRVLHLFIGLELEIKCVNFQSIRVCLYYISTG